MIEIYVLLDDSGTVRYVGQSRSAKKRFWWHRRAAIKHYAHAKGRVYNWIRSVLARGAEPSFKVLETCADAAADERERWWIACFREKGLDLVNNTDGGDGVRGRRHSEETKRKIGARHRGKVVSDGTRRRISEAKRGTKLTEETKRKIGAAGKGREVSVETRALLSNLKMGNTHNLGVKQAPEVVAARTLKISGGLNSKAKVTDLVAAEIRRKAEAGVKQVALVREYGLDAVTVHRIVRRKTYKLTG